jgi:hypothetical protein
MESITFALEAELAGRGYGWTDLTNDVLLEEPLRWSGGSQSTSPTALLASPGMLNFTLDNGPSNSAGRTVTLPGGVTNKITNPFLLVDTTGWYWSADAQGFGYGRIFYEGKIGNTCGKAVCSGSGDRTASWPWISRSAGEAITISGYFKKVSGAPSLHLVLWADDWSSSASSSPVAIGSDWTKLTLTVAGATLDTWHGGGANLNVSITDVDTGAAAWLFCAIVAETGSTAHEYTDNHGTGLAGYYSPGHANCRAGFAKGIRLRLTICYNDEPYSQGIYWIIKDPLPTPGAFGQLLTRVEATDWLGVAKETPMAPLAIQTSKSVGALIPYVLAVCPTQPDNTTSYMDGDSVLATAYDKDDMSRENVYSILGKLARSELGRIYLAGAGILVFEKRNIRADDKVTDGTLDNVMEALEFFPDETAYDQVRVTINPRTVDSVAVQLAKQDEKMKLTPGESKTFTLYYTDPVGGGRISGTDIVQPLVAGTHFKFGSSSGSSQDLNAYLSITLVVGGNSVTVTVENIGTKKGWINLFIIEGKGIYTSDPYTATSGTGLCVLTFDMPYQSNPLVADAVCAGLYNFISAAGYRGCRIDFNANKDADLMALALVALISERLSISEGQTALAGYWNLNGYQKTLGPGCQLDVSLWMQKEITEDIVDPDVSIDFSVITKTVFDGGGDVTWSHEAVAGEPLLVKISLRSNDDPSGATATFNGDAMVRVIEKVSTLAGGKYEYCAIFYLAAPDAGTHDVYVNWPNSAFGGGVSYNCGNCTGYEHAVSAAGNTATPTIDVVSSPNNMVVDGLASAAAATTNGSVGAGQVRRENTREMNNAATHYMITASSTEPGQPTVTMSWNLPDAREWVMCALSLIAGS